MSNYGDYGTQVEGVASPGEHVTAKFNYFLIRTLVNITPTGI